MSKQIKTKALVLHKMSIGDYDKRLVLMTKEIGKINAFAKGSKKSNSKLLAGSEVFAYGDFILYKGRNSYNINSIELIESFHGLRQDIDKLTYGLYCLEFINYICLEENPNHNIMKLTLKTLKSIENNRQSLDLIARIFELKAMSYAGYSPWVYNCIKCNSKKDINYFSVKDGGVICNNCIKNNEKYIYISEGTLYTMQYILLKEIRYLYKFKVNDKILNELSNVMKSFIEYNINKKFNSLQYLDFKNNLI